jgi:gas vesicle protein
MRRKQHREVVYVERGGDSSAKWLFWGALLGAGMALLYAPSSGEETRRNLQRKLWKLRAATEEKLDEITGQFGGARDSLRGMLEDEDEDLEEEEEGSAPHRRGAKPSPREELERRLAEARARRRSPGDLEEPLA